ncbi:Uncharacterised protein [Mycobacteroides abscessus subsp. abscessus]|nr:Uncharacterised protein [Mycobacteroides abscessus subsp. abscessus]
MPALAGRGGGTRHAGGFTAGKVEVVVVGRVRSLERCQRTFERNSVTLQPIQSVHAAVDEFLKRLGFDGIADLKPQVLQHQLRSVLDPGVTLNIGAAAGVINAS